VGASAAPIAGSQVQQALRRLHRRLAVPRNRKQGLARTPTASATVRPNVRFAGNPSSARAAAYLYSSNSLACSLCECFKRVSSSLRRRSSASCCSRAARDWLSALRTRRS
jgi:hypothetical protein